MITADDARQAEDAELARRIARPDGRQAAEAELCRRFWPRIWGYGMRHLREASLAADLAQAVLMILLESLRREAVQQPEQLTSFVLGTCRRVVSEQRRSRTRRDELLEANLPAGIEPTVLPPEIPSAGLDRCLGRLEHTGRRVLVMTFYQDADSAEIAASLRISAGNVRVIRHRALGELRACLEPTAAAGPARRAEGGNQ